MFSLSDDMENHQPTCMYQAVFIHLLHIYCSIFRGPLLGLF